MDILEYIPTGHENAVTRKRLQELTGCEDTYIRHLIMKANLQGDIVLNMEDGHGYFRPDLPREAELLPKAYSKEQGRCYAAMKKMENLAEAMEIYPV